MKAQDDVSYVVKCQMPFVPRTRVDLTNPFQKKIDKITNMEELFMVCLFLFYLLFVYFYIAFYFLPQITQFICSLDFKTTGPLPKGSKEQ